MTNGKGAMKALAALAAVFVLAAWVGAEDKVAEQPAGDKTAEQPADRAGKWTGKGILPGYRGTALPVSGHQVMFLNKGDRVDVLVTFDALMKGGTKEKVTATILQNCLVSEIYKPADPDKLGVVQLLLNPNEAQYAGLARIQGELHIIKRAWEDSEMHPMEMASFKKLFR